MPDDWNGVRIDSGLQPFQVLQQDAGGSASLTLRGHWRRAGGAGRVEVRVVREDDQETVYPWQVAAGESGREWQHTLSRIPAGGLYRTETRLVIDDRAAEWGDHGETIHHWGVGDLWVIAGQSNAAGYGRGPIDDPPRLGVHILKNNERWDIAAHPLNDPAGSTHPNRELANPGHSPYLSFARHLHDALGYPIGLIQTALGNTRLSQWNPEENPAAPLYHNLLHCVALAGGHVRGLLWYQGESDTNPGLSETYEERFVAFVHRLRGDLGAPDLPIILAQSNRYTGEQSPEEHRGWSRLREAQRQARRLGNVAVVPTLDLPLSDDCHTSPAGNLLLGLRKANAALAMVYRRRPVPQYPNVSDAALGIDGRSIELTFDGVCGRLQFIADGASDFTVEDDSGCVPIRSAECTARDRVLLRLGRPTAGAARVHSAFGANPAANLRDIEANVPILAFYGVSVR